MGNEMAVLSGNAVVPVDQVRHQVTLIQTLMQGVMKDGEHYGTIPGCGSKKTLLKPGAEKIAFTFRLAPKYDFDVENLPNGHRAYDVICNLFTIGTDVFVAQGSGYCSTMESKYRFRDAPRVCPECGKAGAIIKGKREYGGGWVCFARKDGCGAKFKDGDKSIEGQAVGKVENENPADQYNTVKKMAMKRAFISAVLTATAASDVFTQDVGDLPEELIHGVDAPTPQAPTTPDPTPEQKTAAADFAAELAGAGSPVIDAETVEDTITEAEWANIKQTMESVGITPAEFFAFMKVQRPGEIKQADLETARKWIGEQADKANVA